MGWWAGTKKATIMHERRDRKVTREKISGGSVSSTGIAMCQDEPGLPDIDIDVHQTKIRSCAALPSIHCLRFHARCGKHCDRRTRFSSCEICRRIRCSCTVGQSTACSRKHLTLLNVRIQPDFVIPLNPWLLHAILKIGLALRNCYRFHFLLWSSRAWFSGCMLGSQGVLS